MNNKGRAYNRRIWEKVCEINGGEAFAVRLVYHNEKHTYIPEISADVCANDVIWSGTPLDFIMEQPQFNEYVDLCGFEEVRPVSAFMLIENYQTFLTTK